jgi:rhodanese-related sulfurtransferase
MNDSNLHNVFEEVGTEIREVSVGEAHKLVKSGKVTIIDIREPEHVALGTIEGSIFIRGDELEMDFKVFVTKKDDTCPLCGTQGEALQ